MYWSKVFFLLIMNFPLETIKFLYLYKLETRIYGWVTGLFASQRGSCIAMVKPLSSFFFFFLLKYFHFMQVFWQPSLSIYLCLSITPQFVPVIFLLSGGGVFVLTVLVQLTLWEKILLSWLNGTHTLEHR